MNQGIETSFSSPRGEDALILHRSTFVRELRASFPGVEPWLAGYRDTLTLEMMRFRHFTEDAIARGDLVTVRKAFEFLHRAFETGNHHVRNRERERMLAMFRQIEQRPTPRRR